MLSTSGRGDVGKARPDGGLVDSVHASAARRDPAGCERRDDRLGRNPPQTAIPAHVSRGGRFERRSKKNRAEGERRPELAIWRHLRTEMKRFIGVSSMSHENKGVRALPPGTCETGKRFRTPFLVCEDYLGNHVLRRSSSRGPAGMRERPARAQTATQHPDLRVQLISAHTSGTHAV